MMGLAAGRRRAIHGDFAGDVYGIASGRRNFAIGALALLPRATAIRVAMMAALISQATLPCEHL